MSQEQIPFPSDHFTLHQLAEGVFAAMAKREGAAISNAGIVDLGNRTLVYDTFLTPQAARDLRAAAKKVTGSESELIVNSHYHNDHIWGNQVFSPRATILSTTRTLHLIETEGREEIQWANEASAKRLEETRKQYEAADGEKKRHDLLLWVAYWQALVDAMPGLAVRLPDITFENRLTIRGSSLTVELIPFEGAHTGSDAILRLPELGIVFASDLLFVNNHPFLVEGDVTILREVLGELAAMKAETYVPGHGPLGTDQDITLNIQYISTCTELARQLVESGEITPERIAQVKLPEPFLAWELSNFFAINIKSLAQNIGIGETACNNRHAG